MINAHQDLCLILGLNQCPASLLATDANIPSKLHQKIQKQAALVNSKIAASSDFLNEFEESMVQTEDKEQPDILTYLKYSSNMQSEKMLEKYSHYSDKPKSNASPRKSQGKSKSPLKKSHKQQQRKLRHMETVASMKKIRMTQEQDKFIRETDYTKDGKNPIFDHDALMKSLTSQEKKALDPYASGDSPSLTEEQLLRIVEKCNNYDLNVQRNKIDLRYLQELKNCLADFNRLKDYIPDGKQVDPVILAKVSKRIEEKILEMFELIRKNK